MCGDAMTLWANKKYGKRKGLQGPIVYPCGRVLYFDPKEQLHWDPTTDFFVEGAELEALQMQLFEKLAKEY